MINAAHLDANALFFGTPYVQNNGQKIVPISTVADRFEWNTRLNVQLGVDQHKMLHTEYGVSTPMAGSDPNRRNLELTLTPELEAALMRFDESIAKLCAERSQEFFGKPTLNKQHLPLVRRNQKDQPVVRIKIVTGDKNATEVRVLGADDVTHVRPFTELRGHSELLAVVNTPGIWANATQFGISFTTRAVIARVNAPVSGLGLFQLAPGITDAVDHAPPANGTTDPEMMDDAMDAP